MQEDNLLTSSWNKCKTYNHKHIAPTSSQTIAKPNVISSAYWVELNGGNILIVVADTVGDACDKLDAMNFENYSIKHDKTMVALV